MLKKITKVTLTMAMVGSISFAQTTTTGTLPKSSVKLSTQLDSVSYSLGVNIGSNIKAQGLESLDVALLAKGMGEVFAGQEPAISLEQTNAILQSYFMNLQRQKAELASAEGRKFLEENKKNKNVVVLPSGLQYQVLVEGKGAKPKATDKVTTHYHGTLTNGEVFDSSVERGQPVSFAVNGVIKGWTEALQLMPVGSKWKLFIPSDLGYGDRGAGGKIGPGSVLIFEVELLSIDAENKTQAPETPAVKKSKKR